MAEDFWLGKERGQGACMTECHKLSAANVSCDPGYCQWQTLKKNLVCNLILRINGLIQIKT
jgi:hypothetical protein